MQGLVSAAEMIIAGAPRLEELEVEMNEWLSADAPTCDMTNLKRLCVHVALPRPREGLKRTEHESVTRARSWYECLPNLVALEIFAEYKIKKHAKGFILPLLEPSRPPLLPSMTHLTLVGVDIDEENLSLLSRGRSLAPDGWLTGTDADPVVPCRIVVLGPVT